MHLQTNTKDVSLGGCSENYFREGKMSFAGRRKPPTSSQFFFNNHTQFTAIHPNLTLLKLLCVNASEKGKLALTSCLGGDSWTPFFQQTHCIVS